jgi:2'-5' RNA ligase
MRTVELLVNDELDSAVRTVWRRLAAAGMPSLADHPHPTNRPHVTLAAGDGLPDLAPALAALPLSVTLHGLVLFEGRTAMLAWRVVADSNLRRLQERVWRELAGRPRNPLHAPDRWVPHVSLARHPLPAVASRLLADLAPTTGWSAPAATTPNRVR